MIQLPYSLGVLTLRDVAFSYMPTLAHRLTLLIPLNLANAANDMVEICLLETDDEYHTSSPIQNIIMAAALLSGGSIALIRRQLREKIPSQFRLSEPGRTRALANLLVEKLTPLILTIIQSSAEVALRILGDIILLAIPELTDRGRVDCNHPAEHNSSDLSPIIFAVPTLSGCALRTQSTSVVSRDARPSSGPVLSLKSGEQSYLSNKENRGDETGRRNGHIKPSAALTSDDRSHPSKNPSVLLLEIAPDVEKSVHPNIDFSEGGDTPHNFMHDLSQQFFRDFTKGGASDVSPSEVGEQSEYNWEQESEGAYEGYCDDGSFPKFPPGPAALAREWREVEPLIVESGMCC